MKNISDVVVAAMEKIPALVASKSAEEDSEEEEEQGTIVSADSSAGSGSGVREDATSTCSSSLGVKGVILLQGLRQQYEPFSDQESDDGSEWERLSSATSHDDNDEDDGDEANTTCFSTPFDELSQGCELDWNAAVSEAGLEQLEAAPPSVSGDEVNIIGDSTVELDWDATQSEAGLEEIVEAPPSVSGDEVNITGNSTVELDWEADEQEAPPSISGNDDDECGVCCSGLVSENGDERMATPENVNCRAIIRGSRSEWIATQRHVFLSFLFSGVAAVMISVCSRTHVDRDVSLSLKRILQQFQTSFPTLATPVKLFSPMSPGSSGATKSSPYLNALHKLIWSPGSGSISSPNLKTSTESKCPLPTTNSGYEESPLLLPCKKTDIKLYSEPKLKNDKVPVAEENDSTITSLPDPSRYEESPLVLLPCTKTDIKLYSEPKPENNNNKVLASEENDDSSISLLATPKRSNTKTRYVSTSTSPGTIEPKQLDPILTASPTPLEERTTESDASFSPHRMEPIQLLASIVTPSPPKWPGPKKTPGNMATTTSTYSAPIVFFASFAENDLSPKPISPEEPKKVANYNNDSPTTILPEESTNELTEEPEKLPPFYVQPVVVANTTCRDTDDKTMDHLHHQEAANVSLISMMVKENAGNVVQKGVKKLRPLHHLKRTVRQVLKESSIQHNYTTFHRRRSEPRYVKIQD